MVLPPRHPSAEMRSILRELQRRRPNSLALKWPATKKPSAPPPSSIGGAGDKVRRPRAVLPCKNPSSITCKSSSSAGTFDTEPLHLALPCTSFAMAPLPPPPFRSAASSTGSASEEIPFAAARLRPGTSVRVRTRVIVKLATKSEPIWLWLRAIVVSAAAEGSYEVVYKGKLPPWDPFSTVHVASDHVKPETQPPPTPLPSRATSPSACAITNTQVAASKNSSSLPLPRPTTAGKSMRLVNKIATETQSTQRPTTAGKSIHVVRKILSEMDLVPADGSSRDKLTTHKPPRAASSCPYANGATLAAAPKTSKIQSAPRPTTAGKSLSLLPKLTSEMQAAPRPTIAGKCIRVVPKITSSMEFQAQAMLPGY
ncbi:hypothetical protein EJB05_12511, partial [Eragrostis curvula]